MRSSSSQKNIAELAAAQELLYASDVHSVLIVLQAMDAAGKDGTIKHVMSGVNPQGCQVFSFKKPSDEELDHNFLWRYMKALPERGRIGIFNRSYYEDVLVVRVHPEILAQQKLPPGDRGEKFWEARYDDINRFERHLTRNGTLILKFFLNVSKKEQKKRFLERLDDEDKHWKFSIARPEGAGLLGRLPGGVRGHAAAHQHEMGAVVGHSGRPQVGDAGAGGRHHDRIDPAARRSSLPCCRPNSGNCWCRHGRGSRQIRPESSRTPTRRARGRARRPPTAPSRRGRCRWRRGR